MSANVFSVHGLTYAAALARAKELATARAPAPAEATP